MYSLLRQSRTLENRANATIKYVCCNCRFPRSEYRFAERRSSSIATLCKNNHNLPRCVFLARNAFAASDCDAALLSSRRNRDDDYKFYYSSNRFLGGERFFSTSATLRADPKPSSKVEETVTALKEKAKTQEVDKKLAEVVAKKSLKQKIIDECVHYYHGFRLLFIDISVSAKLLFRILRGNQLTRREHNLLVRTVSDMFRLVPFSVFIIVPFMELLLPLFIKFFPNMLPSTFQTAKDKDEKMKQSLKVKLEMAKFLQETLDNMTLQGKGHSSVAAKEFAEFCEKVRSEGGMCTSEEIMKFSKLFEDEITLDSLPRPQLTALCRVLELKPLGTSNFLRFQLRMKLRSLAADDVMIEKEGIDSLSLSELQQACRARGMRAYGLSAERLRFQLSQWLDLSMNKKVPPSLLLLSRAFMLPETIPTTDKLKATISALPETVALGTKAAIGEREGKVDNKTKIEIIKEEQRKIQEENKEIAEEARLAEEAEKEKLRRQAEVLVDQASDLIDKAIDLEPKIMHPMAEVTMKTVADVRKKLEKEHVTSEDIQTLQDAMEVLATEKKSLQLEKEELEELKEEMSEYKEDVEDLKEVLEASGDARAARITESKGAKRLFKKVSSMIEQLDGVVGRLENKEKAIKKTLPDAKVTENEELLRIDELLSAIRKIQKIPDEGKVEKIAEVLSKIDEDHDGAIRIDTVLKVVEEIDENNMQLSSEQISELVHLLEKEAVIESEHAHKAHDAEQAASATSDKSSSGQPSTKQKLKIPLPDDATTTMPAAAKKNVSKTKTKSNSKTL